jgi:hypothetical protein
MPRIRSVKPEFFRSKKLAACSPRARLTFIGLWILADDEGRYEYEPELLKADLWPWEPEVTPKETDACVVELVERGRLCLYEHGGKAYLHVVNWHEHQKISHRSESRLPACHRETHGGPPEGSGGFQSVPEDASGRQSDQGGLRPDLGSGSRKGIRDLGSNTVVEQARPDDPTAAVFDAWRESTGKHRAQLDDKRLRKIKAALRTYPLPDVLDAVRGWANSPHHRGENDQGTVYNELTLLLRDAEHIEHFRDLWRAGPANGPPSKSTLRLLKEDQRLAQWAQRMEGGDGDATDRVAPDRGQARGELPRPGTAG